MDSKMNLPLKFPDGVSYGATLWLAYCSSIDVPKLLTRVSFACFSCHQVQPYRVLSICEDRCCD